MQQRLRESYLEMGMDNEATVVPVGMSWKKSIADNPDFELYNPDEGHPNVAGSYLAACTFYCTLFQKSCVGSTYLPNGISADDVATLQSIASNTVLDSTWVWNMFAIQSADTSSTNDSTYSFSATASNYDNVEWDFGDGNTANTLNASHAFSAGQYTVDLSVFSNGGCLVKKESFEIDISSIDTTNTTLIINLEETIKVYPTPLNDYLTVEGGKNVIHLSLYNLQGQLVFSKDIVGLERINLSHLPNGYYIANLVAQEEVRTFKLFKNDR
jgi:hypothetical protein